MNNFRSIGIFVFAVLYLMLTTGITLFTTHCACTGNSQVSVFEAVELCNMPDQTDSCCGGESKNIPEHACGCNTPTVNLLKLTDHLGQMNGPKNLVAPAIIQSVLAASEILKPVLPEVNPVFLREYSPPERDLVGRFLINFLNQRKIALLA